MRKLYLLVAGLCSVFAFWQMSQTQVSAAPIACDGRAFMVRSEVSGTSNYSQLYEFKDTGTSIDLSDRYNDPVGLTDGGTPIDDTTTFPNGYVLNALAYNPVDKYMYAARNADNNAPVSSNDIYRINSDGSLVAIFTANFSTDTNLKGAAFSPDGTYYGIGVGTGRNDKLMIISGLAGAPGTPATMTTVNMSQPVNMGDVVYDFTTNTLYAVSNLTNMLYSINTTTGAVTTVSTGAPNGSGVDIAGSRNGIGSLYMTATGELMGYINNNAGNTKGQLVSIDKSNGVLALVKDGPVTNNSDATACVPVDVSIDTVKSVGAVSVESDTEFTVPYTVQVGNFGTISDPNVQMVDNLNRTFVSGSPEITVSDLALASGPCTLNMAYDGKLDDRILTGTDTLNVGETCSVTFNVHLAYAAKGDVPVGAVQNNTVYASTTATGPNPGHTFDSNGPVAPFNLLGEDDSSDSPTLPSTANGDNPAPTPVVLSLVMIDVVKKAGTVTTVDTTHFTVPYTVVVGNTGQVTAPNVQVVDNLRLTFTAGNPSVTVSDNKVTVGPCTANSAFNGIADMKLLSGDKALAQGESCIVTFTVALAYGKVADIPTDAQNNVALASSASSVNTGHTYNNGNPVVPANVLAVDNSTDAAALPTSVHGDTPSPTPVTLPRATLADTGINQILVIIGSMLLIVSAGTLLAYKIRSSRAL